MGKESNKSLSHSEALLNVFFSMSYTEYRKYIAKIKLKDKGSRCTIEKSSPQLRLRSIQQTVADFICLAVCFQTPWEEN